MNLNRLSHKRRNILWLIMQILILVFCIGYIQYVYYHNILPDKIVENTYQKTQCLISNEKITSKGKVLPQYRADFLVSYSNLNGQQYTSWVSGNGLDSSFTPNLASQQKILQEFKIGQTYSCWYNPNAPQVVVLNKRHNWSSVFPLFIPSIIVLIVFYYFVRTLFHLLKPRKVQDKK